MVAGFFGLRVTFAIKYLKQANYEIVAYALSTIVVTFAAIAVFGLNKNAGFDVRVVTLVSNTVEIVGGMFVAQESVRGDQRRSLATR